jgi:hypothetical protein
MPTISRFYGILIQMYFGDHLPPHFHALYAEFEAVINNSDIRGDSRGFAQPRNGACSGMGAATP